MKNRIIGILGLLLFLSVAYNIRWVAYERNISDNTIAELNEGAKIDYAYVNQINAHASSIFELHAQCNSMLSKDLKGELPNDLLKTEMDKYTAMVADVKAQQDKTVQMKKDRTEAFKKFKYAIVYKPE